MPPWPNARRSCSSARWLVLERDEYDVAAEEKEGVLTDDGCDPRCGRWRPTVRTERATALLRPRSIFAWTARCARAHARAPKREAEKEKEGNTLR